MSRSLPRVPIIAGASRYRFACDATFLGVLVIWCGASRAGRVQKRKKYLPGTTRKQKGASKKSHIVAKVTKIHIDAKVTSNEHWYNMIVKYVSKSYWIYQIVLKRSFDQLVTHILIQSGHRAAALAQSPPRTPVSQSVSQSSCVRKCQALMKGSQTDRIHIPNLPSMDSNRYRGGWTVSWLGIDIQFIIAIWALFA